MGDEAAAEQGHRRRRPGASDTDAAGADSSACVTRSDFDDGRTLRKGAARARILAAFSLWKQLRGCAGNRQH